ncbi:Phosphatidylinositol 4-phosphate 5-kinase 1 [Hondaea fermentalgiana]|uniref:Phosphatidylinositol 4-phosphate 5-kinase 1 n=1 Tax=Hondaea fermentalgiana TaxID=2315210 RepID=A0A2R5GG23_9STRA|nr:Phosphatidylinositol 4-phosphate 5-kinase 1 [Hondaea fermentalgiana]|eukprot:GBG29830.1 Phosphatidylinositol 4-phosphate 5-kinase 1 [Hondaea fermentalgiana]
MYTLQTKSMIVYHGTCIDRKPHGFGRKTFANGSYYEGDWKLGKRHGSGIFHDPQRNVVYEGEWRHGQRDGSGRCRRTALGNWVEYDGWWTKNRKNGEGTLRWSNGRSLRGNWQEGQLMKIEIDKGNRDHGNGCIDPQDMSLNFPRMQMDPQDVALLLIENAEHDNPLAGAESAGKETLLPSPARRKLVDRIMASFVIGNTHGRALWTSQEASARLCNGHEAASHLRKRRKRDNSSAKNIGDIATNEEDLRFLYLGVGDLRNPLKTLHELEVAALSELAQESWLQGERNKISVSTHHAHFVLNDASTLTLARDAALLLAAVSDEPNAIEAATALWCDALVTAPERSRLDTALDILLDADAQALPKWLTLDQETRNLLEPHWRAWRKSDAQFDSDQEFRVAAIRRFGDGAGHGRAQTSQSWLETGVSSRSANRVQSLQASDESFVPNPLLYDFVSTAPPSSAQTSPLFIDSQGPTGAFSELANLKPGGTALAQVLGSCWRPLWSSLRQAVARGAVSIELVAGDCIDLLSRHRFGARRCYAAIDTSNVADYVGLWNLLLLCEPLLEPRKQAFVQTENILTAAETLEDLLASTPPRSVTAALDLAALMGLIPAPAPAELAPDPDEKIVRTRWNFHEPTARDVDSLVSGDAIKSLVQDLVHGLPASVKVDKKVLEEQLLQPELQMLIELARANPGPEALNEALANALNQSRARKGQARIKAAFESTFFLFLHDVLVPQPVTPDMLRDPRQTIAGSYPFPTHTVLSATLMLASIADRSEHGRDLARDFLAAYFRDSEFRELPHVRLRGMALRIMCARLQRARPDTALRGVVGSLPCRSVTLDFETIVDVWKPKGGLLEPALALLLVTPSSRLAERLRRDVGIFYIDETDGLEHNQNFEHVSKATPRHVQVVDNVRVIVPTKDGASNMLTVQATLPSKHPYARAYLLDVQTYSILTKSVHLGD